MLNEPNPDRDRGQAEALRALYAEHGRALLACALRFTADRGRAEDAVQETFLRAWRHLPALADDERPARAWLFRVLRRVLIDADRARRIRPVLVPAAAAGDPAAAGDSVEQLVNHAIVKEALTQLSADQRQLVIDTFFNDIPLHISARRLGIPAGTARSRLHYALSRMRRYLDRSSVAA